MSRFWGLVWGEEAPHQNNFVMFLKSGAGEGIRTLDPNLGNAKSQHYLSLNLKRHMDIYC
jgi:hypothetical protein